MAHRKALISMLKNIEIEIVNGKGRISNKSCEDINDFVQVEAVRDAQHRDYMRHKDERDTYRKKWKEEKQNDH
jgi:hypothetical protein